MTRFIDRCVEKLTKIPYPVVPNTSEHFLQTHSRVKLAKKFLHRHLQLRLSRQLKHELRHIQRGMRVLWVYTGKANFGDAIMDLSGRALLRDAGVELELLTLPKLLCAFDEDDVFAKIYSNIDEIEDRRYDAIVLNEFNYQSIDLKIKHFRTLPFACLFQYFYGPDRNQTLFSFAAVNDIFGIGLSDAALRERAKPYLHSGEATRRAAAKRIADEDPFIALAVGGIDARRTYPDWPRVLTSLEQLLDGRMPRRLVLLGSENGLEAAHEIVSCSFRHFETVSLVGQLSLLEAREVIAGSVLFVGCDGGLMHVAHTTDTPSVTLFAKDEPPHLRLTERCHSVALHSDGAVSQIAQRTIAQAIFERVASAQADRSEASTMR